MSGGAEHISRASGLVRSVRGLGVSDHICLDYDDPDDFRARLLEFLADGVALGQRIQYLGSSSAEELRSDLEELEGLDGLIERGAARIFCIGESAGDWRGLSAAQRVFNLASGTREALAAGFTGLRGVCEGSSLIGTPDQRDVCAQTEYLTDRFMTTNPLSSMCAYRREVGQEPVAEMACLHPLIHEDLAPFRLYAGPGGSLALCGEIDFACGRLFDKALERTLPLVLETQVDIDASGLSFIDHRGLLTLERHAGMLGTSMVLRGLSPTVVHVASMLDLSALRVEAGW